MGLKPHGTATLADDGLPRDLRSRPRFLNLRSNKSHASSFTRGEVPTRAPRGCSVLHGRVSL